MWLDLGIKQAIPVPFLVFASSCSILLHTGSCLRLPVMVRLLPLAVQSYPVGLWGKRESLFLGSPVKVSLPTFDSGPCAHP